MPVSRIEKAKGEGVNPLHLKISWRQYPLSYGRISMKIDTNSHNASGKNLFVVRPGVKGQGH